MQKEANLNRFIDVQKSVYARALEEIKTGRKVSHWMWFIFPQIQGLGFSETSKLYAIKNIDEAKAFLDNEVLGRRLLQISATLLSLATNDANKILGSPDDMKLQSCMTLFGSLQNTNTVFQSVLDKFLMEIKTVEAYK